MLSSVRQASPQNEAPSSRKAQRPPAHCARCDPCCRCARGEFAATGEPSVEFVEFCGCPRAKRRRLPLPESFGLPAGETRRLAAAGTDRLPGVAKPRRFPGRPFSKGRWYRSFARGRETATFARAAVLKRALVQIFCQGSRNRDVCPGGSSQKGAGTNASKNVRELEGHKRRANAFGELRHQHGTRLLLHQARTQVR